MSSSFVYSNPGTKTWTNRWCVGIFIASQDITVKQISFDAPVNSHSDVILRIFGSANQSDVLYSWEQNTNNRLFDVNLTFKKDKVYYIGFCCPSGAMLQGDKGSQTMTVDGASINHDASIIYVGNSEHVDPFSTTSKNRMVSLTIIGESLSHQIFVSSSEDGITFSEYVEYDSLSIPQSRYLKFRAKLSGGEQVGEVSTFEFDQSKPETEVELGEFLESIGSNIQFKTVHNQPMIVASDIEGAKTFEASIDKTQWKQITRLIVK
jgi:hypothetical protein